MPSPHLGILRHRIEKFQDSVKHAVNQALGCRQSPCSVELLKASPSYRQLMEAAGSWRECDGHSSAQMNAFIWRQHLHGRIQIQKQTKQQIPIFKNRATIQGTNQQPLSTQHQICHQPNCHPQNTVTKGPHLQDARHL